MCVVVGWFLNTARRTSANRRESSDDGLRIACGKASRAQANILHLHSCYVSKAAILTVSTLPVPAENRSPA
jgi:hypothetical protein